MNVVSIIMIAFALLGAADYLLNNKFGLGKEFEKGFSMLGTLSLSMIGMIVLAPTIAQVLTPVLNVMSHIRPLILPSLRVPCWPMIWAALPWPCALPMIPLPGISMAWWYPP